MTQIFSGLDCSSVLETLFFIVRSSFYRALETDEKGRCSHHEQRPSPRRFCSEVFLLPRIG